LISFAVFFHCTISGQTFLNGSFENTGGICSINLHNNVFNYLMSDCFAFGTGDNLDILIDTCGFGLAQEGNFYIGLAVDTSNTLTDALSLKLSSSVISGHTYTIYFYNRQYFEFEANLLEVGYSSDSLSFGNVIDTAAIPSTEWEIVTFSFSPIITCRYITIRSIAGSYGWNQVDNFNITETTGVNDPSNEDHYVSVFPNPTTDFINIKPTSTIKVLSVIIKDIFGKTLLVTDKQIIDLSKFSDGIYFVEVNTTKGRIVKRVIKQ